MIMKFNVSIPVSELDNLSKEEQDKISKFILKRSQKIADDLKLVMDSNLEFDEETQLEVDSLKTWLKSQLEQIQPYEHWAINFYKKNRTKQTSPQQLLWMIKHKAKQAKQK